jgi:hypothetical protein
MGKVGLPHAARLGEELDLESLECADDCAVSGAVEVGQQRVPVPGEHAVGVRRDPPAQLGDYGARPAA